MAAVPGAVASTIHSAAFFACNFGHPKQCGDADNCEQSAAVRQSKVCRSLRGSAGQTSQEDLAEPGGDIGEANARNPAALPVATKL